MNDPVDPFLMSPFRISRATPDDVPALHSLIRELAEFENLSHLMTATPGDIAGALFAEHPVAQAVVGFESEIPVAFALYFSSFSTFLGRPGLYLEDLYVRPVHRRRGYGRALLIHLAHLARERGCGRFEWAVLNWNASAIAFYEKLGALILDDWRITRLTGPQLDALAASPLFLTEGR